MGLFNKDNRLIDRLRRNKIVPTPDHDNLVVTPTNKIARAGLREWLTTRLEKRTELASERKWMFISVAVLALIVMCNSAFNIILSAIGLVLKGIGSVVAGIGSVINSLLERLSAWIKNK